jgi:hypothetical protein
LAEVVVAVLVGEEQQGRSDLEVPVAHLEATQTTGFQLLL